MGRSKCPQCEKQIPWTSNLPLLSFFLLKRKCQFCAKPIHWQYPAVEFFSGVLFVVLFIREGFTPAFLAHSLFFSMLFIISVIDIHLYIIPDVLSLPGSALGFLASFGLLPIEWKESLYGFLVGGGLFFSIAFLYEKLTKKEGLGGGDVKLLAMIGAWLGIQSILPVIILSSFLGSLIGIGLLFIKKREFKSFIPFGPFLSIAALLYFFFEKEFLLLLFPGT